ncbi:hypothetical protein C2E21_8404 [Chlorella sorokiniana]|uniref:SnoaL-like domain-containing protein n=1 Tax=Chlorella sorokiniana TaxID=3076 RepID=A0A2P6TEM3_CHLSO|nr:hypothetical protein C2E21_8404 [Chlorella sorokiniana]|eukprot:PRW21096.1 hypothetical protein C2E21_8404 [Chlorella sorokiniana]
MLACLAPDVAYLNLALAPEPFRGQQAVRQVLASLVASAPPDWRLVVDDATPTPPSSSSAVAVVFHLEDGSGQAVPLSRGVAFYRLDQAGRIAHITEAAEQVVKMPQAVLPLSGLQKTTAMQLIEGVEIEQQGSEVAIRFLTVVPFFKVTERVELGATSSMGRRDLRGGSQRATAAAQPDGSLRVDIAWEEPNAGSICEQWRLVDGGSSLECSSTVAVRAGSVTTRTLYRRSSDGWRPRFQWNPLYNLMGGSS